MVNDQGAVVTISPRVSVMNAHKLENSVKKRKGRRRASSAFTLEYRQLRTEADEHVLKSVLGTIKKGLFGSRKDRNKIEPATPLDSVQEELPEEVQEDKKKKAKKRFSVDNELLADKFEQVNFMVNPIGHTKLFWDALVIFFVIWNCCSVPYHTALQPKMNCTKEELANVEYTDCYPKASQNFDVLVYVIFWFDLLVQSRTGYVNDQQHIVMGQKLALKHYLMGWFLVDFVAAIPFDYISAANSEDGFMEIRLIQLLKLMKIAPLTRGLDKTPYANIFRLTRVIFGLMMLGHWIGCMYFYLGMHQINYYENEGCNDNTGCPWLKQYNMTTANLYTQYSSSLYWGMTMLTSVEFGYVSPHTNVEKFFAWFCQLLGAIITAIIFGEVVAAVQDFEGSNSRYRNVMGKTNQFLKFHNLPKELAKRVRNNMEYGWTLHSGMDQHGLLEVLPAALRVEVLMHVQKNVIQNCTMFKDCDKAFVKAMCLKLEPNAYLPFEVVYEEGDATRDVFFVSRGRFKVVTSTGRALTVLTEGDYFGELSYFDCTRRSASVVAVTYGEVYYVTHQSLDQILESFPEFKPVLRREAKNHAKVYDKGTFHSGGGVRRKSLLLAKAVDPNFKSEVDIDSEAITPWLDDEELSAISLAAPSASADALKRQLSAVNEEVGGIEKDISVEDALVDLPSPKFETPASLHSLEIQCQSARVITANFKKLYEKALKQERLLQDSFGREAQRKQEEARMADI